MVAGLGGPADRFRGVLVRKVHRNLSGIWQDQRTGEAYLEFLTAYL